MYIKVCVFKKHIILQINNLFNFGFVYDFEHVTNIRRYTYRENIHILKIMLFYFETNFVYTSPYNGGERMKCLN